MTDKNKTLAQLKIAILCKQIVDCKWYQFLKRKRLYDECIKLSKEHDIEF